MAEAGQDSDSPTTCAQVEMYLMKELSTLGELSAAEKNLDYHKHSLELLKKPSNSHDELNKLLGKVEEDSSTEKLDKSDVLKIFAELCLVLKNAAQENEAVEKEERSKTAEVYYKLFERAERLKNEYEFEAAREKGFEGNFEEYVEHLRSQSLSE